MKWIKRLCSFIFLCVLIAGCILVYQGYSGYRDALGEKSVEEMREQIESIDNYTPLDELPQTYIDAVLAVEDKRFYSHPGIDPIAIGRAVVNDIRAGAYVEGGSTITQQLAKNQFFTQEKKMVRKISEMDFDECTLLAGIPNAPSNYNPVASPELARQRQAQVLEKMKRAGYLE